MTRAIELQTDRLILKPLSLFHVSEEYANWLNDPEVYKYLDTGGNYTLELLKEFLAEVEKKSIYIWGIHLKENMKHIGNIKIDPIYERNNIGEYGILMGDREEWKKGYGKEASICVIDFCFKILSLRKITLGVIEDNRNAVHMYLNLGFSQEGLFMQHGIYNGKYCNCVRMALFNPNF